MRTAINLFVTAMVMLSVGYITYDVLRPVDKVVTTYTCLLYTSDAADD